MPKKPTKAQFFRMLGEIEMRPGDEHQPRTDSLLRVMLNSPPNPYTPKLKKKRRAKK